ncbi:MAG: Uma2 family endonuclease [Gammaproteobacteria bacterium]|nr:Uma2 family endonuclease [Gammaproteobacteria bacterium]
MRETETVPIQDDATTAGRTPLARPLSLSDYPESDGKPMAETPIHWHATVDAALLLQGFYRDRADVYVGSDMMMYYRAGDIRACVSPDIFVAIGVPKLPERRVWRTWVEGKLADFVLEITSFGTRRVDEGTKKELYAELGVREYWQFDPEGDYLDPMLQGRRLGSDGKYRKLALERRNGVLCHGTMLGLELRLEGDQLRFFDPRRGGYLLTAREGEEALRGTEEALRAAEAENAELRRRLRQHGE